MNLLQIQVDNTLKQAIQAKAKKYGITASALIRIVLIKSFMEEPVVDGPGNVFNAQRDNQGKGIKIDDLIAAL